MSNKRKKSNLFSKTTDERLEIVNEKSKKNGGLSNISNYSSSINKIRNKQGKLARMTKEDWKEANEVSKRECGLSKLEYNDIFNDSGDLKNIINYILSSTPKLIKHGCLNEKILLELKMNTSLYNYIEVLYNLYTDEDYPDFNNWTDVEGMGYGWKWLRYKESEWHKMMCKIVDEHCDRLLKNINKVYYFVYKQDKCKVYHFVTLDEYRKDTIISLSNEEIDY